MRYPEPLQEAVFLRRYKRFLVDVELPDGRTTTVHLANTGGMHRCTAPRAPVRLSWSTDPKRKLPGSVEQIRVDGCWILVNSARPNAIVAEAIAQGRIAALSGYDTLRREVAPPQGGRLDVQLRGAPGTAWVEVKNVTLREGDRLRFPDAVTTRGARHAQTLAALAEQGDRAVLLFLVGTEGGEVVELAEDIDPAYAAAVRDAAARGVEVLAVRCAMSAEAAWVTDEVPVRL